MELDLLYKTGVIVNMYAHRNIGRLLEEEEFILKNTELRVAPGAVLRDEFRPTVGCRFTANDLGFTESPITISQSLYWTKKR